MGTVLKTVTVFSKCIPYITRHSKGSAGAWDRRWSMVVEVAPQRQRNERTSHTTTSPIPPRASDVRCTICYDLVVAPCCWFIAYACSSCCSTRFAPLLLPSPRASFCERFVVCFAEVGGPRFLSWRFRKANIVVEGGSPPGRRVLWCIFLVPRRASLRKEFV